MPGWLKPLLQIFASIGQWFQQRQLISAGETKQRAKDLEEHAEATERQARAAADAADNPDELADRLRDKPGDF